MIDRYLHKRRKKKKKPKKRKPSNRRIMKLLLSLVLRFFLFVATAPPTFAVTAKPRPEPGTICPAWDELKPCIAKQRFKVVPEQYKNLIALDKSTMYAPLTPLPDFPQGSDINLHLDMIYYIGPSWSGPITAWNGMSPSPTIHVQPGQTLKLTLKNQLEEPLGNSIYNSFRKPNNTNIHLHGLHISGEGMSDNILVDIPPGNQSTYTFEIAENHMPGTHWTHPHHHGSTALQTGSGVAGMLVVDDPYGYLPKQIELLPEIRMMILQLDLGVLEGAAYNITAAPYQIGCWGCPNGSAGALYWGDQGQHIERTNAVTTNTDTFLINMQYIPVIKVERGKWYRMRMVLASVSEGITFRVPDGCDLELLAKDGIYLDEAPRSVDAIFLLPGSRADVAIRCDLEERAYSMDIISTGQYGPTNYTEASQYFCENENGIKDRFLQDPVQCNSQPRLAVLHVMDSGSSVQEPDLKPFGVGLSRPCYVADTRNAPLGADPYDLYFWKPKNEIIPEGNPGAGGNYTTLTVNGNAFDPIKQTTAFPMGTVNQINYLSVGKHPYHQHVAPFQIAKIEPRIGVVNGLDLDNWYKDGDWGDTIQYVVTDPETSATLRFATDSYSGRCIFHCHILIHEDMGMMGFYNFTGPDGIIWEGAKIVNPLWRLPTSALLPYTDPTPNPTNAPVRPPSSPPPSPSPTRKSSKKKSKSSKSK